MNSKANNATVGIAESACPRIPAELEGVAAALKRFHVCAEDSGSEGCDIGRSWFDALTTLGLLVRTQRSPAVWTMTAAGERLLALIDVLNQQRAPVVSHDSQRVAPAALGAHEVHPEMVDVRLDPTEVVEHSAAADALVHGTGVPLGDDQPMTTFTVTLEEFKRGVAEFCQAAPACDAESLEHGFKAVGLMFLGTPDDRLTQAIARSYLDYASRRKLDRELEVDCA